MSARASAAEALRPFGARRPRTSPGRVAVIRTGRAPAAMILVPREKLPVRLTRVAAAAVQQSASSTPTREQSGDNPSDAAKKHREKQRKYSEQKKLERGESTEPKRRKTGGVRGSTWTKEEKEELARKNHEA